MSLASFPGSRKERGRREPGTDCARMRQVNSNICHLLRSATHDTYAFTFARARLANINGFPVPRTPSHIQPRTRVGVYTDMATLPSFVCRVCMDKASKNHYSSLFSPGAYQKKISSRLGSLLEMEVDAQDGLPSIICDKCKRRFEALEKAMHDLTEFRQMAKASLVAFSVRGPLKRKKECSVQTGVSPDIARSRPPLKRITVRRLQYTSMLIKATITINY